MTPTKSSESPLQNKLKIFVDDQKLKKLCVSTFESAHSQYGGITSVLKLHLNLTP